MVRTVVGDEAQVEAFLNSVFASSVSVQVGLLIGRLSTGPNRDVVYSLIPTPAKDGEQACKMVGTSQEQSSKDSGDKKKPGRGRPGGDSSSLMLDIDWIAEHARQISRMLLGGMCVIGIYCVGPEVSTKNSLATLWQVVKVVASTGSLLKNVEVVVEPLLLHVSSSPRRLSCKSCLLEPSFTSASIKPCDWKLGKLVPTMQSFMCHHTFNIRLPILENGVEEDLPLRELLLNEIEREFGRLNTAPALVNGVLAEENVLVENDTENMHNVQFLLPFGDEKDIEGTVKGLVSLHGTVHARSYALLREPLARALTYLKEDIVASFISRISLLCDVAEQELEYSHPQENGSEIGSTLKANEIHALLASPSKRSYTCSILLPRRVFIPWSNGTYVSDYLLDNESIQDVNERWRELFGRHEVVEPSMLVEPEAIGQFTSIESVKSGANEKILLPEGTGGQNIREVIPVGIHTHENLSRLLYYAMIGAANIILFGVLIAFLQKHLDQKG